MRLDDGWNQIQFNLSDFTRRAYGEHVCMHRMCWEDGLGAYQVGHLHLLCLKQPAYATAGTNYIETLRVQVHANCRIRRIYFSDRLYSEEELPPEFKLFLPIQKA